AFDALAEAKRQNADVLLIDTAGRLHNKADLMAELQKIVRVLKKVDAKLPHAVLLELDATAKGGVLVSLAEKYGIAVHYIGVGESADDLRPFEAEAFARSLVGLEG